MPRCCYLFCLALALGACAQRETANEPSAGVTRDNTAVRRPPDITGWPIVDGRDNQVGLVATRLQGDNVVVEIDSRGLPPGRHGVHIHETPKCEAPSFTTAGHHWNFRAKKHGHLNPQGHHAGDLGNLEVAADGTGRGKFFVKKEDWDPKLKRGLSIVIHAQRDDEQTDPSGNSGVRIACGLVYLRQS